MVSENVLSTGVGGAENLFDGFFDSRFLALASGSGIPFSSPFDIPTIISSLGPFEF
jgi:hypothetical protein